MTTLTTLLASRPGASPITPSADLRLIYGLLIVAALFVALVTFTWAREHYRKTRRRWLLAKPIWVMVGVGMELLAGSLIAVGMYGELGYDTPLAMVFLAISVICGVIGIILTFIGSILSLIASSIAFIRSGSHDSQYED